MNINYVSGAVIDSGFQVHSALGPGLLESAYTACLAHELRLRGLAVRSQVPLPVMYKGTQLDVGYRLDLVVGNSVVVEVKAVARLAVVHEARLLSYLRLSGKRLGLLLNFHELHFRDGIKRMVL